MHAVRKNQLIREIHAQVQTGKYSIPKMDVAKIITALEDVLRSHLIEGEVVMLHHVGSLVPILRRERTARSPTTQEIVTVPAKRSVRFRTSRRLLRSMNE